MTRKRIRITIGTSMLAVTIIANMFLGCGQEKSEQVNSNIDEMQINIQQVEAQTESESKQLPEETSEFVSESVPTPEPEPIPEPDPARISLIMVGDILLHTPVEASAKQEDGTYNYDAIFANTKDEIGAADLAIVNQEVIIGGEELGISGYPAFNAPFEMGHDLVEAGFDVICHGTNHALDKGKKGLLNCLNFWADNYPNVTVLGVHETREDSEELFIYEQDGIKIALLNYTYSTNGVPLPEDMPFAVDMLTDSNKDNIIEDIKMAEELADFTVICPHWGTEYYLDVDSHQKKWTKVFLENGVDLVIGTHPHVIGPIEMIKDEETGHEMLVYYSLGNFVNWTSSSGEGIANRMVGGMAQVTIEKDESGNTYIQEYGIKELVCHLEEGTNGVTVYLLDEYTEELAGKNQIIKQDSAFSLHYCKDLVADIWENMY